MFVLGCKKNKTEEAAAEEITKIEVEEIKQKAKELAAKPQAVQTMKALSVSKNIDIKKVAATESDWTQTNGKTWEERNKEGKLLNTYQESNRDQWSIYLTDGKDNIQLDLWTKKATNHSTQKVTKILTDVKGSNKQVAAKTSPKIDATKVSTATADWLQTADKTWEERNKSGKTLNTYQETGRDEWSVYLSGPANVQLDLHRKEVINRTTQETAKIQAN